MESLRIEYIMRDNSYIRFVAEIVPGSELLQDKKILKEWDDAVMLLK
jgi:hypothetical protein